MLRCAVTTGMLLGEHMKEQFILCLNVLLDPVSQAGQAVGESKRCCNQLVDSREQLPKVQSSSLGG